MIIPDTDVLQTLNEKSSRLIHLFGEADAGRTLTVLSMARQALDNGQLPIYILPNSMRLRRKDIPELCPVVIANTTDNLIRSLKTIIETADIIFIDDFLQYILHKPKKEILAIFRALKAEAWVNQTVIVLVNDYRYLEEKGGYHPAYQEYFRRFCGAHIKVEKDEAFNIHYRFIDRKTLY